MRVSPIEKEGWTRIFQLFSMDGIHPIKHPKWASQGGREQPEATLQCEVSGKVRGSQQLPQCAAHHMSNILIAAWKYILEFRVRMLESDSRCFCDGCQLPWGAYVSVFFSFNLEETTQLLDL